MLGRVAAVVVCAAVAGSAQADEQMRPLAVSGQWAAMAHADSMMAPPDMCMVVNVASNVGFRKGADTDQVEFRVANDAWSLPVAAKGTVLVQIGSLAKSYDIGYNTDKMISAALPDSDVLEIFAAMDKASNMTVTVGKAKPLALSLAGSTKATNAFRTCAGIKSNAASPGSNPFQ